MPLFTLISSSPSSINNCNIDLKNQSYVEWKRGFTDIIKVNQTMQCEPIVWKPITSFPFHETVKPLNLTPYISHDKTKWLPGGLEALMNDYQVKGFLHFKLFSGLSNQICAFNHHAFRAILLSRILVIPPLASTSGHASECIVEKCFKFTTPWKYLYLSDCSNPLMKYSHFFSIIQPNNGTHYIINPFYYVYATDYLQLFNSEFNKITQSAEINNLASTYIQSDGWDYDIYDLSTLITWNNNIRNNVQYFLDQILSQKEDRKFIGVHLRRGDYSTHCRILKDIDFWKSKWTMNICYTPYSRVFQQVDELKTKYNISNVIVITDENQHDKLQLMKSKGWILASELWKSNDKLNLKECPGMTLSLLDQCLMTFADHFIGNLMSTFSMHIRMLRKIEGKSSFNFT